VLRALACLHGEPPPATAAQRRALWERAGIECDALSTSVLVAGLRPTRDGPLALTARAWAALGQAVRLTRLSSAPTRSRSRSGRSPGLPRRTSGSSRTRP
jgi:hypothetical protein